jgi:hypothetical protein
MSGLPAGLADPLHMLEPEPSQWQAFVAAVALLALFAWWQHRRWRRRTSTPEPPPAPPPASGVFERTVEAIRDRARKSRRYRRGCHELGVYLRQVLAAENESLERLTAREISRRLGEDGRTRLLTLISDSRFGKRPPDRDDLDTFCDLALDVHGGSEPRTR